MGKSTPYHILYEDKYILVVDKPSGIPVLPERWEHGQENLLELVRSNHPGATTVHRIDKETSGLLVLALTAEAARSLQMAFEARQISKIYHALVAGNPSWDATVCDWSLVIDGDRLHRSIICKPGNPEGRRCESRFRVLERYRRYTLLEVELLTGRTHQIRAHAAFLGFPIAGDHLYNGPKEIRLSALKANWHGDIYSEQPLLSRVGLHARKIAFSHPISRQDLEFVADYPKDLRATLAQLARLR